MLPIRQLPREDFFFADGVTLSIRGLSRAEAIQTRSFGDDVIQIEVFCIASAAGTTEDEARAWHATTSQAEVEALVNAIIKLSGLNPDSGKVGAEN